MTQADQETSPAGRTVQSGCIVGQTRPVTDSNDASEEEEAKRSRAQVIEQAQAQAARHRQAARIEDRVRDEVRAKHVNLASEEDDLTEQEQLRFAELGELQAWDLMRHVEYLRRDVGGRTEEELIAEVPRNPQLRNPLELTRRLIDSNRNLQAELVRSRESSELVAADLSSKMTELTGELVKFRESSDGLAGRVLWWSRILAALTVLLFIGTFILIWLTAVLVQRTP
jgi:hypothetical protein